MKVKSKFKIENKMIITLDGDILEKNADSVLIDGKKYRYDIAYDMPSTIGVEIDEVRYDEVSFTIKTMEIAGILCYTKDRYGKTVY